MKADSYLGQTHTHTHLYTQDIFFGQRTLPAHSFEHAWVGGRGCGEKAKSAPIGPVQFIFIFLHLWLLGHPRRMLPSAVTSLRSLMVCPTEGGLFGHSVYLLLALLLAQLIQGHCRSGSGQNQRRSLQLTFPSLSVTPSFLHP